MNKTPSGVKTFAQNNCILHWAVHQLIAFSKSHQVVTQQLWLY